MNKKAFGVIFYLHLALILGAWAAPFWLSWKFILFFVFLYYFQLFLFGRCILTKLELGEMEKDMTFYFHYFKKVGLNLNKRKLRIFLDYIAPWLILMVALLYQRK